jgi:periplasmic divalent cation tolerance protein
MEACLVLTTCVTSNEAETIARTLVEEHLAACINVVGNLENPQSEQAGLRFFVQSFYRWEGQVESAPEVLLLMKTIPSRLEALEKRIGELHSYDTPELIAVPIFFGSSAYLNWIKDSVQVPTDKPSHF